MQLKESSDVVTTYKWMIQSLIIIMVIDYNYTKNEGFFELKTWMEFQIIHNKQNHISQFKKRLLKHHLHLIMIYELWQNFYHYWVIKSCYPRVETSQISHSSIMLSVMVPLFLICFPTAVQRELHTGRFSRQIYVTSIKMADMSPSSLKIFNILTQMHWWTLVACS